MHKMINGISVYLILLFNGATSLHFSENKFLGKCCPSSEVFSLTKDNCIPASPSSISLHVAKENVTIRSDGFPNCSEPEDITTTPLEKFTSNDYLYTPACLEVLAEESTPFIVHCQSNKDRKEDNKTSSVSLGRVANIRRCCPWNMIYDLRRKFCVPVESNANDTDLLTDDDFISFLPSNKGSIDFFIFTRGPPGCAEVVADFEIDVMDLFFENQILRAKVPPSMHDLGKETVSFIEHEGCVETVTGPSKRKLIARVCGDKKYCAERACVRKCCPEGEAHFAGRSCQDVLKSDETVDFRGSLENFDRTKNLDYDIVIGDPCIYQKYTVDASEGWYLTDKGLPYVPGYKIYEDQEHCIDMLYNTSDSYMGVYTFVCFDPPEEDDTSITVKARFAINVVLQLASCFFLFLTLLVYVCLPVLQNLHGKTLMCHVGSLLVAFICLSTMMWATPDGPFDVPLDLISIAVLCKTVGYTMLFAFLSAFSWLNIMCFDIWWTFGGLRGSTSSRGRGHRKRFMVYCAYAWGLALVMTVAAVLADHIDFLPYFITPHVGFGSCWFTQNPDHYGELLFFIGPVTVQLTANLIFFILTTVHCSKVKAEIKRVIADPSDPRSRRYHSDRTKLIMNVKLFIVMGISWILEVLSFFLNNYARGLRWRNEFFYISDMFNCLQGLLIFILFVLKTRVYLALRRRLGLDMKKKTASNATTALHDPFKVKKSASNTTLTSTFAVSQSPGC